ncbi:BRO1-domain-containing protein [Peniophora sp. CONT]|nr:BRO1-domain-containing protein [Peniophora sp. CONT]
MPNQLSLPSKKTYVLPIREAVDRHIRNKHPETHPDAFKADVDRWEALRVAAVEPRIHTDTASAIVQYHAQLVFALTKLPANLGLDVVYESAFASRPDPTSLPNLHFERCATLYNLAARYSQLAMAEDRSKPEGVKQANGYYQHAAGVLSFLVRDGLPKLQATVTADDHPADLSEPFVKALEWLMLAQAQECVWQRAVLDRMSNGVIARLAAQVSAYYGLALNTLSEAPSDIRHELPSGWLAHLETKQLHFDAASQYRQSINDLERNNYGSEIARLTAGRASAKKGYDVARRAGSGLAQAVLEDIKSLLDIVEKNLKRAERDNDLIYHEDVPPASALASIPPTSMVRLTVPTGLEDPKTALGKQQGLFAELLSWGARVAIELYEDRKATFIKEEVAGTSQSLDDAQNRVLRELNLPSAVDALDAPIGLPPSLLRKAEEVRVDQGPERIGQAFDDVQMLAERTQRILDDALDILDAEASEDEKVRLEHPERPPSHEANEELTRKAERYRAILQQAAESDSVVRERWDEWQDSIERLAWDEDKLEASVPATTGPTATGPAKAHARGVRALLEDLDDLSRARQQLVGRGRRRAEVDDIQPRIVKGAAGIEQWMEVQPGMFEDTIEEELVKYEKFRSDIVEGGKKQDEILERLRGRMKDFLASRSHEPAVKEREAALQELDLAYHKYNDITRHLDEGHQFYNDLSAILLRFQQTCKEWTASRRDELRGLTHGMRKLSVGASATPQPAAAPATPSRAPRRMPKTPAPPRVVPDTPAPSSAVPDTPAPPKIASPTFPTPPTATPQTPKKKFVLDLPPPDSDAWTTMDVPAPPPSAKAKGKKKRELA